MTTEEKAKAYDEALERAKKQREDYQKELDKTGKNTQLAGLLRADISAIELAFPELAESEDERVRKEMISFLRSPFIKENLTDEKVAPWIAYLEKQKSKDDEEKHLDGIKRDWFERGKKEVLTVPELYGLEKQKEQKHPNGCFTCDEYKKGYEEGRRNGFTAGYNKAMKEVEQKEQKPDTRDGDDLQLLGFIYDLLNEIEWKDEWTMSKEECLRRISNYRPQKPTEWSKEDKDELDCIINVLDRLGFEEFCKSSRDQDIEEERFYYKEIQFLKRLKSLRPQPHTVSVENATKFGNLEYERGVKDGIQHSENHRWKPTEEQMIALSNCVIGNKYEVDALVSLWAELKKIIRYDTRQNLS